MLENSSLAVETKFWGSWQHGVEPVANLLTFKMAIWLTKKVVLLRRKYVLELAGIC